MRWDDIAEFGGQLLPFFAIGATLAGGAKWFSRHIDSMMDDKLEPIIKEVKPNGGSSIKDEIARLGTGQTTLSVKMDEIGGMAEQYHTRIDALLASTEEAWYEADYKLNENKPTASLTFVNDAYLNLFQLTWEEAIHTVTWRDRIPPDDLNRLDSAASIALYSKTDFQAKFNVLRHASLIPVHCRAKAVWSQGVFKGWSGAMTIYWRNAVEAPADLKWPPPPTQPWS